MNMTREDVLRELELLPVWQLRAQPIEIFANTIPTEAAVETPLETAQQTEQLFDYFVSENNTWVFVCPASRIDTASQSMLFDNILVALQIKVKKTTVNLAEINAKLIVAMGEKTAQTFLSSTETIDSLRSKQHVLHNLPLIVTYSAAEMIEHLPNKAKTWHDLCTALRLVNA